MATLRASKVLSSLPGTLQPDTMYCVRVGTGFDFYVTDSTGAIAYKVNGQTGTPIRPAQTVAYTFVAADAGTCTPFNLSAAADGTIPPNSSVPFPVGTVLYVRQQGAGAVTLVAGAGVTLNAPNGAVTTGVGDWRAAVKVATDAWDVL